MNSAIVWGNDELGAFVWFVMFLFDKPSKALDAKMNSPDGFLVRATRFLSQGRGSEMSKLLLRFVTASPGGATGLILPRVTGISESTVQEGGGKIRSGCEILAFR